MSNLHGFLNCCVLCGVTYVTISIQSCEDHDISDRNCNVPSLIGSRCEQFACLPLEDSIFRDACLILLTILQKINNIHNDHLFPTVLKKMAKISQFRKFIVHI